MLKFLKSLFDENPISEPGLLNGAVVLDVRPPSEFQQGHLRGSKNIPISEIRSKVEMIRRWNRPVITVCKSGARSAVAKSVLAAAGIEVYNGGPWTNLRN
ncbi:MAG: rhodanese-like domain-containing protein [Flavisolibacter sp.]